MSCSFATFLVFTININIFSCTVYYVNPASGNSGGVSGQSWLNSFNTLDSALLHATQTNDEIYLMGGFTYIPITNNRANCFVVHKAISIFGGFDGTETNITQRQSNYAPSIISGDINILNDNTDNCYHVITYNEILTLNRVIIQNGNANYNDDYSTQDYVLHRYGGALITAHVADHQQLYLQEITFRNNTAINGGALFFTSFNGNNVDVVIKDSIFEYNKAIDGLYEGGYGGAVYIMSLANITIFNTEFTNNKALYKGGAIYQDYGALLYSTDSIFHDNKAIVGYGGAIFSEDRNSQTTGTFPTFESCIFKNNFAAIKGGAIFFYNGVIGSLINNTFRTNIVDGMGGGIALVNSESVIISTKFASNIANKDITTNDVYNETELVFENIDTNLTFDLITEMNEIYDNWIEMQIDLYPYNNADDLCFVDIDNMNSNKDGNSWNTAYNTLQECLNKLNVNGGEIWVKTGTYTPTEVSDWKQRIGKTSISHYSFVLYDNTRIYGGFDGTEITRDERNFSKNPTYLSCEIGSNIQCNQIVNAADNTLIDGFIFINAGAGNSKRRRLANSVTIEDILSSTKDNSGSGIYSNSTNINIVNSIFYKLFTSGKGG
eukprot:506737_1